MNNPFDLPRIEPSAGYARATQLVGCLRTDRYFSLAQAFMPGFLLPPKSRRPPASAGQNPSRSLSALKGVYNEIILAKFPRHECLG